MAAERKVEIYDAAQAIIDKEIKPDPKLSDFWEGLKWRLSRDPLTGAYRVPQSEPPTYIARGHHWGVASLVVIYRFDATELHVVDLAVDRDIKADVVS